jgi:hypothetical protein
MPTWVKGAIDAWTSANGSSEGPVLRRVNRGDRIQAAGMSEKVVWQLLQQYAAAVGFPRIAPHDLRRSVQNCAGRRVASWSKSNFCSGTLPSKPRNAIWGRSKI